MKRHPTMTVSAWECYRGEMIHRWSISSLRPPWKIHTKRWWRPTPDGHEYHRRQRARQKRRRRSV